MIGRLGPIASAIVAGLVGAVACYLFLKVFDWWDHRQNEKLRELIRRFYSGEWKRGGR